MPRSSVNTVGVATTTPAMTSDSEMVTMSLCLLQVDAGVITEHQAQGAGAPLGTGDLDLPTDERVGDAGHTDDPAVVEHHRVVDLRVVDLAVGGDRGERPDVAVHDVGSFAHDGRAPDAGAHDAR